jgi:hypothetical protein
VLTAINKCTYQNRCCFSTNHNKMAQEEVKSSQRWWWMFWGLRRTVESIPLRTEKRISQIDNLLQCLTHLDKESASWFTLGNKHGVLIKEPRYEALKWFMKEGWSFYTYRKKLSRWNPLRDWMDWLSIGIALLSTHHIARIGAQSPIRVLPLELIRRLKGFLFKKFPSQPQSELQRRRMPLCAVCSVQPACGVCGRCRYCKTRRCRECGPRLNG